MCKASWGKNLESGCLLGAGRRAAGDGMPNSLTITTTAVVVGCQRGRCWLSARCVGESAPNCWPASVWIEHDWGHRRGRNGEFKSRWKAAAHPHLCASASGAEQVLVNTRAERDGATSVAVWRARWGYSSIQPAGRFPDIMPAVTRWEPRPPKDGVTGWPLGATWRYAPLQ